MASQAGLDIGIARIVHLNWELQLERMVSGGHDPVALEDHETCELGRWIHSTGVRAHGDLDELPQLIEAHRRFHQAAQYIVLTKGIPLLDAKVGQALEIVRSLSREILFLLTAIELRVLENEHQRQSLAHPLRRLIQAIFEGPFHALPGDDDILNVSQARLIHLRWAQDLTKAFRHRGRDVTLESAEKCAMGVWLRATGLTRHGQIEEVAQLDALHQAFHDKAEQTLRALRGKRDELAERHFGETRELSRKVIYLLSVIEFKLLESSAIQRSSSFLD
ncbi:MAG: CZB domain-containing protein [Magnetococcales bacterium]|nr:CZB domain-containing protein [Magnetococcales bacterium]